VWRGGWTGAAGVAPALPQAASARAAIGAAERRILFISGLFLARVVEQPFERLPKDVQPDPDDQQNERDHQGAFTWAAIPPGGDGEHYERDPDRTREPAEDSPAPPEDHEQP
jgi:hypothetical protein